jgi:hypothetical protein
MIADVWDDGPRWDLEEAEAYKHQLIHVLDGIDIEVAIPALLMAALAIAGHAQAGEEEGSKYSILLETDGLFEDLMNDAVDEWLEVEDDDAEVE